MTKFITSLVLAASVLAGIGAAQAGPGYIAPKQTTASQPSADTPAIFSELNRN